MKTVNVYCGITAQSQCGQQLHPINEVKLAEHILDKNCPHQVVHSNNPDFVSAMKYIGKKKGIYVEFFLDGVSQGNDIEEIFKDFNKALTMISDLGIE